MQIIPTTAQPALAQIAKDGRDYRYIDEAKFDDFEESDLHDPALNILIACQLSAIYGAWHDGQVELVASAWNAGPGSIRRYGGPPAYRETQNFIVRTKGYMVALAAMDD